MVTQDLISILAENKHYKEFLLENRDFEVSFKSISENEMKRLVSEYPKFFLVNEYLQESKKKGNKTREILRKTICLALVKYDADSKNYSKLKKIKFYYDEINNKILKILQN